MLVTLSLYHQNITQLALLWLRTKHGALLITFLAAIVLVENL